MPLTTILQTLLIGPLKLVFEIVFVIAERVIGSPGLAIIALSLVINVLMLPLHRRADAVQEQARDKEAKMKPGVDHIKKTFSGDERMMILQTYYRQNDYRPTDALKGSVSLLLEVPFFMAAYQFLSNLAILEGTAFGPVSDLGSPDGMLVIGTVAINVLPIAMTAINIASGAIYSRGFPMKTKIQMYGLALVFLVLLYDSPSGLVFYWTLNNLFSLGKNLILRVPGVKKSGSVLLFLAGLTTVAFALFIYQGLSIKRELFVLGAGVAMMLPLLILRLGGKITITLPQMTSNQKLFWLGAVFITVLTGVLIPSTYIAASPQEYVDISYFHDPSLYVLMAACLASGTFLVWMGVFYWLASENGKAVFGRLVWILCGVMLVNYMFFGRNLGILYSNLQYSGSVVFTPKEEILNVLVLLAVGLGMLLLVIKREKTVIMVLLTATIAIGGMSGVNMLTIRRETERLKAVSQESENQIPQFTLSQNGKNVVVIMLDRGLGQTIPYIINEKPELREKFAGFTHYSNTVSFGGRTIFGVPALTGGYEYTPVEMNKRSQERMVDKHNEALKVLPALFYENDYSTTVINAPFANHQIIPDMSIFDEYEQMNTYLTNGVFKPDEQKQVQIDSNYRNFFCFSIMKSMPVVLQQSIYSNGSYNRAPSNADIYASQQVFSAATSEGYLPSFMEEYSVLSNMDTMTAVTEESINTYMFLRNGVTHEPMLLQTPAYVPAQTVDNTAYEAENADRFTVDGKTLHIYEAVQMMHYHVNMAAMLQLGEWFDYLRENGVYDNTRIILVADHGQPVQMQDALIVDTGLGYETDVSYYDALLMVKDFDSREFTVSTEFMTNADVPTLATAGLLENPVNPFTGKTINSQEKFAHDQMVIRSDDWDPNSYQDQNTYLPSTWASVHDNSWDPSNWSFSDQEQILTEHSLS